jgi:hypothetical protein
MFVHRALHLPLTRVWPQYGHHIDFMRGFARLMGATPSTPRSEHLTGCEASTKKDGAGAICAFLLVRQTIGVMEYRDHS